MADSLILPAVAVLAFVIVFYPISVRWLKNTGMCRMNYRGAEIPVGVGILLPFSQWSVFPWMEADFLLDDFYVQSAILFTIALAGWLDDRYGGNEAKGLKGHLMLYLKDKKISTGLWKALIGAMLAAIVSNFHSSSLVMFMLHFVIMVLMTNLVNLLDLRPGRAIKGFFLLFIPFLFLSYSAIPILLWLPIVLTGGFLLLDDLAGRVMLGDTGANVLGMALGLWTVLYAPLQWKLFAAGLAVLIQLYAEKKSITALIQRTPVLYWIDRLGRKEV